jgi:hypothetical protein
MSSFERWSSFDGWFPRLTRVFLSFASPKERNQRKGDPCRTAPLRGVPCAAQSAGRLAKLAFGSDNASRLPPALLRCSAAQKGTRTPAPARSTLDSRCVRCWGALVVRQRFTAALRPPLNAAQSNNISSCVRWWGPLVERRATQGGRGKSARVVRAEGEFSEPPGRPSSAGNPAPAGRSTRGRLFFGYFLLAKQKKVRPRGRRGNQRQKWTEAPWNAP